MFSDKLLHPKILSQKKRKTQELRRGKKL
jgi:translation initiation factor 5B